MLDPKKAFEIVDTHFKGVSPEEFRERAKLASHGESEGAPDPGVIVGMGSERGIMSTLREHPVASGVFGVGVIGGVAAFISRRSTDKK